jgi:putative membrane protein
LLVRWGAHVLAVALTVWVLPGVSVQGGILGLLSVSVLLGLVNVLVQTLMRHLPRPDSLVLLGAVALGLNAALILLVSALTDRFTVTGVLPAFEAATMLAVFSIAIATLAGRLLDRLPPARDGTIEEDGRSSQHPRRRGR